MSRLLCFARPESLLPALLRASVPDAEVHDLEAGDVEPLVHRPAPAAIVLEPAADADWCGALAIVAARRFPGVPLLVVHRAEQRALALRLRELARDAVLVAEPLVLDEFAALVRSCRASTTATRAHAAAMEPRSVGERGPSRDGHASGDGLLPRAAAPADDGAGKAGDDGRPEGPRDLDGLALFVRGLAHEINNPLTTIRGLLQLRLHTGSNEDAEGAEALATMDREARRIADVIQELEYFTGQRRPARTPVDLVRLVGEALASTGLQRARPRVEGTPVPVLADRDQLTLALRHLFAFFAPAAAVAGAANGQGRGGHEALDVVVRFSPARCVLEVAGPPPKSLPADPPDRLLIPLYGGAGQERPRRKNLATVYGILRTHGGSLQLSRPQPGTLRLELVLPT